VTKTHFAWIGAALLGGVTLWGAHHRHARPVAERAPRPAEANATRSSDDATLLELRSELGQLRAQVGALQPRPVASPVPTPTAAPAETAPSTLTLEQQRAESEQRWHDHMAEVALNFDQEPRDPRWAASTSQVVASALERDATLAALAGPIDCRTNSCRLEVERDADGTVDKELPLFLNSLVAALPEMEAEHAVIDGKPRYTLYLKAPRSRAATASN